MFKAERVRVKELFIHSSKKKALIKFLLVLFVFAAYFFYISFKFGAGQGILVTLLTWSFFVLCTPIADAGFLLDFPLRLILHLKMWLSEIFVWLFAISLNLYFFFLRPEIYESTDILKIFHLLLSKPWPYWSVIILSALGTFLSIFFADELMDKIHTHELHFYEKHKINYALLALLATFAFIFFLYFELIKNLGLKILE